MGAGFDYFRDLVGDLTGGREQVLSRQANLVVRLDERKRNDSSLIDEDSFLAADSAASLPFTGNFIGDGQDLRSIFDGVLKMLGAVLVMKRVKHAG